MQIICLHLRDASMMLLNTCKIEESMQVFVVLTLLFLDVLHAERM